jgi:hypothetical protein
MKHVLDSIVALEWVLRETDDAKAIGIRGGFKQGIHERLAPDVFPIEVAPSLARAGRRGEIKHGEGSLKMADVFTYMPALHPYLSLLPMAFAIASQARIGV